VSWLRRHPVTYITAELHPEQQQSIRQAFQEINEPRILVTNHHSSQPWPANVRVIEVQAFAYLFSRAVVRSGVRPRFKKSMQSTHKALGFMVGQQDLGRSQLVQILELFGITQHALHSSPEIGQDDNHYDPDPLCVNDRLPNVPRRHLGTSYERFDINSNLRQLPDLIETTMCWLAMDPNCLVLDLDTGIQEKALWGWVTGTPQQGIWHPTTEAVLRRWGFRGANWMSRRRDETEQQALARWLGNCEQLVRIHQEPEWAQRWYDSRAADQAHDCDLLRRLPEIIDREIQQQIDELPPEWQALD